MALSTVRPSWAWPSQLAIAEKMDMSWEELARLSDRELLLLLHQRLQNLEEKVESRWQTTWKVLAWVSGFLLSVMGLFIAGHAAKLW